jgi:4a-hydroxytetrahydrobiopterin dehydratase
MGKLIQEKCVACRGDVPRLSDSEIAHLKSETSEWQLLTEDDIPRLNRVFSFKNFAEALAFTLKLGELAESEGHHPAILTEWGRVTVSWWTHKIRGLHRNDFIMASKTDAFFAAVHTEEQ